MLSPTALETPAAGKKHGVNDTVGGKALPRSITPTVAVVGLTSVDVMSAVSLSCAARCACGGALAGNNTIKDRDSCNP